MTDLALFEKEVRDFLSDKLTPRLRRAGRLCAGIYADRPIAQEWLEILNERGWAVPDWPVEWGGNGWSLDQKAIFDRELVLASAPVITPNATHMVAPALMAYGTEEQKQTYLPRIRSGEDWWAQGYSEPGAGSDLANLQCAAVRDGDEYVINGSKIWTTHAHWSNKMFCLVRTDNSGKKQQGISFLLFDLNNPGIEVRPLISMSGDHEFNQVFFNNARVPVSGLLGEENDGWTVAKYLLTHERGSRTAVRYQTQLHHLREFAAKEPAGHGNSMLSDPDFARKVSKMEIRTSALESLENTVFNAVSTGESVGASSSALKILHSELRQDIAELAAELVAYYSLPYQSEVQDPDSNVEAIGSEYAAVSMPRFLNDRATSIYAGSNEIQHNILAKAELGL